MCALRWYVKSLYRHLFLVDISKLARVTHFLFCGKDNSKAPWATRPQIGLRVAKARTVILTSRKFLTWTPPPPPPELWCWGEAGSQKFAVRPRNFCDPASLVSITATCFSNPQTNLGARCSRGEYTIFLRNLHIFFCTCHNLRWYVKSLYRHFFFRRYSQTCKGHKKKRHFQICKPSNCQVPWATDPKLVLWLPTSLSCDISVS